MAATSHKGGISFGLVYIPTALYAATKDDKISFNLLHRDCGSRIQQKRVCPACGREVSNDELVKGYEYEKGKYVTFTDDDFEKIKTEKDKTIHILQFTNLENINPIYFEKSYYAIPDAGGEKAFELLRTAMLDERKVAIAKTVIGNAATSSETLLALVPTSEGILIETLFYESEVKPLPKNYAKPAVVEAELDMAKTMIAAMDKPFEIAAYHNEYIERQQAAIQQKIAGQEIVVAQPEQPGNVVDLMSALAASVEQLVGKAAKPAERKPRSRKKAAVPNMGDIVPPPSAPTQQPYVGQ